MRKKNTNIASPGAKKWVCPSCKNRAKLAFCPVCGEERPANRNVTAGDLLTHLFQAFSSVDGRLLRTVRYLVSRPGVLTNAFMQGRRVLYIGPFQLFLAANVLFFAIQSLINTNIVSSSLDSHLSIQDWSVFARRLVDHKLAATGMSLDAYAVVFNQTVIFYGKLFIILMVLPFALLLLMVSWTTKRTFATYIVFSLHFYAFLLFLFCISLTVAEISLLLGLGGLNSPRLDAALTLINLVICSAYLYAAIGVVFGTRKLIRVAKAVFLGISVTGILLGYRFLLFLLTLYTT